MLNDPILKVFDFKKILAITENMSVDPIHRAELLETEWDEASTIVNCPI